MPILICYKERNLSFCTLYGVWGDDFYLKNSNFRGKKFSIHFISFNSLCYYCCSINLKTQSEHSGLRLDTSSLVSFQFESYENFRTNKNFKANKIQQTHYIDKLIHKNKSKQDCSYQGKILKFRLPFNVYGAVIT